jgi:hypothetical protein
MESDGSSQDSGDKQDLEQLFTFSKHFPHSLFDQKQNKEFLYTVS